MRFKRRSTLVTLRRLFRIFVFLLLNHKCDAVNLWSDFSSIKIIGTLSGILVTQTFQPTEGSPLQQIFPVFSKTLTESNISNASIPLENINATFNNATNEVRPRRLTKLPQSLRSSRNKESSIKPQKLPDSAVNRARLLLESLNRQNCFAKVLCGLGARPPSTKTDLVNDYVYLMEELMVDDDPVKPSHKTKKGSKNKGAKPYTKNDKDESDSSQSKQSEEQQEVNQEDRLSDWGFMADTELIGEDPQVLKYMQLEKKKKKHKHDLPDSLLMRRRGGRDGELNATVVNDNISLRLQMPLSTRKLARQLAYDVKAGRTFAGNRRQCRTIFDQCPFDETQMNEIITNLKKMMTPQPAQGPLGSKTTTKVTTTGANNAVVSAVSSPQGSGSKVEIILHLNQNGMPYHPGYPMQYNPQMANYGQSGIPGPYTITPGGELINGSVPQQSIVAPSQATKLKTITVPTTSAPTTTTSTTPTSAGTTEKSPADEQLLDFLYGVVNFNESELTPINPLQQPPNNLNPYWSIANSALQGFDDIEHKLQLKQKPEGEDDDDSKSSEEMEIKQYLKSLKETLQGLAQMNNASAAVEQKLVRTSSEEETSSAEDPLDDDFPFPGIVDDANINKDSEEDDGDSPGKVKEVGLKHKGKKKKKNKNKKNKKKVPAPTFPSTTLIATTGKPSRKPPSDPDDPLFDDDNEDNEAMQSDLLKLYPSSETRRNPNHPPEEDDEYEPEESNNESEYDHNQEPEHNDNESDEEQDDFQLDGEESEEKKKPAKSKQKKQKSKPGKIKVKFDPIPITTDPDDLSDKDKRKLLALSKVLLPTAPGPFRPKRPIDVHEEIRIPTVKPVQNEFQSLTNIVKGTQVINIDDFAENSVKTPKFPKRQKKKGQRPYSIRYQNKRKQPATRPVVKEEDEDVNDDNNNSESSEEYDSNNGNNPQFSRNEHFNGKNSSANSNNGKKKNKGNKKKKRNSSERDVPMFYPHPNQGLPDDSFDFFGSVMNMMGMKPVSKEMSGPNFSQHGPPMEEYPHRHPMEFYGPPEPQPPPRPRRRDPNRSNERMKSDALFEPQIMMYEEQRVRPNPKIAISVPMNSAEQLPSSQDDINDDLGKKKKGDKDDKKDGGDKKDDKKDGGDKKDKKKKSKKKSKKKKHKGGGGVAGFSTQFHQQVYPGKEEAGGIWDKIKGFVGKLSQSSTGETPFVQIGFSEKDPLDGNPHAVSSSHEYPGHGHGHHGHAPIHQPYHGHGGGEEEEDEEEEEDDIVDPVDDDTNQEEYDGSAESGSLESDDDNQEDTTDPSLLISTNSTEPTTTTTTVAPTSTEITTTNPVELTSVKTTIAPKPPKYKVNRNQLANKKKKIRGQKPTAFPGNGPVMLFSSTTEEPPATTTEAPTPEGPKKPPKRRIFYKPPSDRINNVPGTPIQIVTAVPRPLSTEKPLFFPTRGVNGNSREEDDEKEPPTHFFQPGIKGQHNVRGRPPIPISQFHIQSEDMLVDSQEEKFRNEMRNRNRHPYDSSEGSQQSPEDDEDREHLPFWDSPEDLRKRSSAPSDSRRTVIFKESRPKIEHPPIDEENRGSKSKSRRRNKHKRQNHQPPPPPPHNPQQSSGEPSFTTSVMNSPIFSDYFKHLYTKFG